MPVKRNKDKCIPTLGKSNGFGVCASVPVIMTQTCAVVAADGREGVIDTAYGITGKENRGNFIELCGQLL